MLPNNSTFCNKKKSWEMIFLFLFLLRVREISAGRSNYPFRGLLTPSPVFMLPTAVHIYVYVDTQFTNSASSYSFTMGSRSSSERDLRLPLRWSLGLVKRKSLNFDIQVGVFLQESSLIVHRGDKWRCNRCGTYRQTNKRTKREDSATQSMDSGHWRNLSDHLQMPLLLLHVFWEHHLGDWW